MIGPYRSGTSLITSMIASMGASLGYGAIMPGDAEQEYYENMMLSRIQNRFLESFGGSWAAPVLPHGWQFSQPALLAKEAIKRTLEKDYPVEEGGPYVLKSTIACILKPLWPKDMFVVKVARSQWEQIESLQKAYGLTPFHAMEVVNTYATGLAQWGGDWQVVIRDAWNPTKMAALQGVLGLGVPNMILPRKRQLHFGPTP